MCLALFFVGNMKDSSRKRLRPRRRRCQEQKREQKSAFFIEKNHTLLRAHMFHTFYIIYYHHIEVRAFCGSVEKYVEVEDRLFRPLKCCGKVWKNVATVWKQQLLDIQYCGICGSCGNDCRLEIPRQNGQNIGTDFPKPVPTSNLKRYLRFGRI